MGAVEQRTEVPGQVFETHAGCRRRDVVRDRLAAVGVDDDPVLRDVMEVPPARALRVRTDLLEMPRPRVLGLGLDGDDEARAPAGGKDMVEITAPTLSRRQRDPVTRGEPMSGGEVVEHGRDPLLSRPPSRSPRPVRAPGVQRSRQPDPQAPHSPITRITQTDWTAADAMAHSRAGIPLPGIASSATPSYGVMSVRPPAYPLASRRRPHPLLPSSSCHAQSPRHERAGDGQQRDRPGQADEHHRTG